MKRFMPGPKYTLKAAATLNIKFPMSCDDCGHGHGTVEITCK